jgi:hypothetical protein
MADWLTVRVQSAKSVSQTKRAFARHVSTSILMRSESNQRSICGDRRLSSEEILEWGCMNQRSKSIRVMLWGTIIWLNPTEQFQMPIRSHRHSICQGKWTRWWCPKELLCLTSCGKIMSRIAWTKVHSRTTQRSQKSKYRQLPFLTWFHQECKYKHPLQTRLLTPQQSCRIRFTSQHCQAWFITQIGAYKWKMMIQLLKAKPSTPMSQSEQTKLEND